MMRLVRLDGAVGPLLQELCRALELAEGLRFVDLPGDIGQAPAPDMRLDLDLMPTMSWRPRALLNRITRPPTEIFRAGPSRRKTGCAGT